MNHQSNYDYEIYIERTYKPNPEKSVAWVCLVGIVVGVLSLVVELMLL